MNEKVCPLCLSLSVSLSLSLSLSHTHTHTHTYTQTHAPTLCISVSLTHTYTDIRARTHSQSVVSLHRVNGIARTGVLYTEVWLIGGERFVAISVRLTIRVEEVPTLHFAWPEHNQPATMSPPSTDRSSKILTNLVEVILFNK